MCKRPDLAEELLRLTDENLSRLQGVVAAANVIVDSLFDSPDVVHQHPDEAAGLQWVMRQAGVAVDRLSEDLHRVLEMARKAA